MSASPAAKNIHPRRIPPFAKLGLISRTLIALCSAFLVFFGAAFLTIITLLVVWIITGRTPDFSIAYRITGLSAGILAFVAGLVWNIWAGVYRLQHPSLVRE
jgi:hypothetical protein